MLHPQHLPHFDDKPRQQHQQTGQDAEHLRQRIAVARLGRQAERKLGEEGDEIGVVVGQRAENEGEPRPRALGKGRFGLKLLGDVVDIIPGVDELPPPQRPEGVDHGAGPRRHKDSPVEKIEVHAGYVQHPQRPHKDQRAAPQAHQREKRRRPQGQHPQQNQNEEPCPQRQPTAGQRFWPGLEKFRHWKNTPSVQNISPYSIQGAPRAGKGAGRAARKISRLLCNRRDIFAPILLYGYFLAAPAAALAAFRWAAAAFAALALAASGWAASGLRRYSLLPMAGRSTASV